MTSNRAFRDAPRRAIARRDYTTGRDTLADFADELLDMALTGNLNAIKEIENRIDGKVSVRVEITASGADLSLPIQFAHDAQAIVDRAITKARKASDARQTV